MARQKRLNLPASFRFTAKMLRSAGDLPKRKVMMIDGSQFDKIERPATKWMFKVGDTVKFRKEKQTLIGMVVTIGHSYIRVMTPDGVINMHAGSCRLLDRFDDDYNTSTEDENDGL